MAKAKIKKEINITAKAKYSQLEKLNQSIQRTATPNKYAHLVEGGVGKYSIAPRPLYKAAYTASLHDMEQEIMKTVHKGLEVAVKKGKATRAPAAPGQELLSF